MDSEHFVILHLPPPQHSDCNFRYCSHSLWGMGIVHFSLHFFYKQARILTIPAQPSTAKFKQHVVEDLVMIRTRAAGSDKDEDNLPPLFNSTAEHRIEASAGSANWARAAPKRRRPLRH